MSSARQPPSAHAARGTRATRGPPAGSAAASPGSPPAPARPRAARPRASSSRMPLESLVHPRLRLAGQQARRAAPPGCGRNAGGRRAAGRAPPSARTRCRKRLGQDADRSVRQARPTGSPRASASSSAGSSAVTPPKSMRRGEFEPVDAAGHVPRHAARGTVAAARHLHRPARGRELRRPRHRAWPAESPRGGSAAPPRRRRPAAPTAPCRGSSASASRSAARSRRTKTRRERRPRRRRRDRRPRSSMPP